MTDDAKPDARVLAAGAERIAPKAADEKRGERPERGSWFVRHMVAPLVSGLALVASYGCYNSGPENTDSGQDADVEEAVEDVGPETDGDVVDVTDELVEDADADVEEAVEDVGPETDVVDVEPDADAVEDEASDVADAPDEAGCSEIITEEREEAPQPDVGDPAAGGSTQTRADVDEIVSYEGEACDGAAGSRTLDRIEYNFAPPLDDFGAATRMGIITSNLADAPVYKVIGRDAGGCIITGKIVVGERIGPGMPTTGVTDGDYLVRSIALGETAGARWVDIGIWNLRMSEWVRGERVNEGDLFTLPNGNRGMPTGIDLLGGTVRMDILEPADYPLCEGAVLERESDSTRFTVRQNIPEGWSFFAER